MASSNRSLPYFGLGPGPVPRALVQVLARAHAPCRIAPGMSAAAVAAACGVRWRDAAAWRDEATAGAGGLRRWAAWPMAPMIAPDLKGLWPCLLDPG